MATTNNPYVTELVNTLTALLDDTPQANGEYVHHLVCSASRKRPVGEAGCVCKIGQRVRKLAVTLDAACTLLRDAQPPSKLKGDAKWDWQDARDALVRAHDLATCKE